MGAGEALRESRIDLVGMIRDGIKEREFIAGTDRTLAVGKRHHVAADRKSGKSLVEGVCTAVRIVQAGGSVAILDRENGADEYARRLESVMTGVGADAKLWKAVAGRYSYYEFPHLQREWETDPSYVEHFAGCDLVIFDSSRAHLTSLGLKENSNDDFADFTEAVITPLYTGGVATMILDNTGWSGDHARGASTKGDLCDVLFRFRKVKDFSTSTRGEVELIVDASRLGELDGAWSMELGGGHYGPWVRKIASASKVQVITDEIIDALAQAAVTTGEVIQRSDLAARVGRKPDDGTFSRALTKLTDESRVSNDGGGYTLS
jgi:hypothetical protein